jgi:hypothetical protein
MHILKLFSFLLDPMHHEAPGPNDLPHKQTRWGYIKAFSVTCLYAY